MRLACSCGVLVEMQEVQVELIHAIGVSAKSQLPETLYKLLELLNRLNETWYGYYQSWSQDVDSNNGCRRGTTIIGPAGTLSLIIEMELSTYAIKKIVIDPAVVVFKPGRPLLHYAADDRSH